MLEPAQRRELVYWIGGALVLATVIVVAAVLFVPELDLLAKNYAVL